MNPWHDVDPGKRSPEIVDCIIEIPRGCRNKYELDKKTGLLRLDRVLYSSVFYPANYGFIPRTYCDDSDPLDILVLGQEPVVPMCIITARPIGLMQMVDENEEDDKIIAIHEHDPAFAHYRDISHLSEHTLLELKRFFEDYKALENKKVHIERFMGRVDAQNVIDRSLRLYDDSFAADGSKRPDAPMLEKEKRDSSAHAARYPARTMRVAAARRAAARLQLTDNSHDSPHIAAGEDMPHSLTEPHYESSIAASSAGHASDRHANGAVVSALPEDDAISHAPDSEAMPESGVTQATPVNGVPDATPHGATAG